MEILRSKEITLLQARLKDSPVVAILGPRQCGKTTLALQFSREHPFSETHVFDLEKPQDLARLENPTLTLGGLKGLVIIDEVQRKPELFPTLRVLVDRRPSVRYLILGSASRDLICQSSESLAGRISYMELGGFSLDLLSPGDFTKLWVRGGFPRSFLARDDQVSFQWRQDFITTFLERDVPNLGIRIPAPTLRRFWMMLSHYHGQIFNASEIGRNFSASDTTMKRYLDLLSGTFVVRQLQPWFYNTKRRLVKRPKLYFRDSGLFHTLIGASRLDEMRTHPKLGASWEGFALEQAIQHLNLREEEVFFWAAHTGADLDLVFFRRGKAWGIEAKYNEAPTYTKSMASAVRELALEHLWVLYPGRENYDLHRKVSVLPISKLDSLKT